MPRTNRGVALVLPLTDVVDPADVRDIWWQGTLPALLYGGLGVALLVLVTASGELARRPGTDPSTGTRVSHMLGVLGAIGWIVTGGFSIAEFGLVSASMAETGADRVTRLAALQAVYIAGQVGPALAAAGLGGGWPRSR